MYEKYEWTKDLEIGDFIYIESKGFFQTMHYKLTKIHEILPNGNLIFIHNKSLIFDLNGDTDHSYNYNKELKRWSIEIENKLKEKTKYNKMLFEIKKYNKFHILPNNKILLIHNILFEKEKENE